MNVEDKLAEIGAFAYDLEIISAIPARDEVREPDLHYCEGWDDHAGMGISVVTAYDFVDRAYRIYLQDNLDELRTTINSRGVIIGFNSNRFDNNVLAASQIYVPAKKSYDLWVEITKTQPDGQRRGYALKNMLEANGLQPKSGLGSDAPGWAQRGQWGILINYCLDDTRLMVLLLRLAMNDMMQNPKGGGYMKIAKPWEIEGVESGGLFGG